MTPFRKDLLRDFCADAALLNSERIAAVFMRMWFRNCQSPKIFAMFYYLAEEIIQGDPADPLNTLQYDKVVVNVIGTKEFNPALPNVYKWDAVNQHIAGDLVAYVDDLRTLGFSLEHVWQISRQVASRLQLLGIQDATRKRCLADGPWAGRLFLLKENNSSQ